jgi:hypothetical protein
MVCGSVGWPLAVFSSSMGGLWCWDRQRRDVPYGVVLVKHNRQMPCVLVWCRSRGAVRV